MSLFKQEQGILDALRNPDDAIHHKIVTIRWQFESSIILYVRLLLIVFLNLLGKLFIKQLLSRYLAILLFIVVLIRLFVEKCVIKLAHVS